MGTHSLQSFKFPLSSYGIFFYKFFFFQVVIVMLSKLLEQTITDFSKINNSNFQNPKNNGSIKIKDTMKNYLDKW